MSAITAANSSGQSSYPNQLDFEALLILGIYSSGQSSYPNQLD